MEYLHNGFCLQICEGAFPLTTDSIALAHFAKLPRNAKVLDLGAGCAALGLLLCAADAGCTVTGIELDPAAHACALKNAQANHIPSRLNSICENLVRVPSFVTAGSFDVCISNPPYFADGLQSASLPDARSETQCSMHELFNSAAWALRYGGDFYLVHRPERLAELFA